MMAEETWDLFKSELKKEGFSLRRLDDQRRNIRYRDDVYSKETIDRWMNEKHPDMSLENIDHETMLWLVDNYIESEVPTDIVNEEGDPDWSDETYDLWYGVFEYATLFDKYVDWKVRDELNLI